MFNKPEMQQSFKILGYFICIFEDKK